MSDEASGLFTRLAPVLNERDLAAERAFYERLGLPVIYEGPEYPDFIGFGTETVYFGIQKATADNDPPGVLTWQIGVTDIDTAIQRCHSAGISFDLEDNNLAPGWTYRRRRPGQHRGVDLVAVMQPGWLPRRYLDAAPWPCWCREAADWCRCPGPGGVLERPLRARTSASPRMKPPCADDTVVRSAMWHESNVHDTRRAGKC